MTATRLDKSGKPTADALADEKILQEMFPAYRGVDADYVHAGSEALERFWDWKFGLRIHWSVYSIPGRGWESWPLRGSALFREQYEGLYRSWMPTLFDADEWCDMMVRAGIKFFSFTTKHHDGFSMYDTKTKVRRRMVHTGSQAGRIVDCDLAYGIMETPFRRDVTHELVDAAHRRSLGISLYFSHIDWFDSDFRIDEHSYQRDPDYTRQSDPEGFGRFIARHREQIRELCTNYGKIDMMSFDMGFPDGTDARGHGIGLTHGIRDDLVETVKMARRLQPEMLMRHRGIGNYGDYTTPEGCVPHSTEAQCAVNGFPWRVIYPGGRSFSFIWEDTYKPAGWIISNLVYITAKGGNFEVGYGPGPTGEWDPEIVRQLEAAGDWLRTNGEGIYATRPYKVFKEGENVRFTRTKDGTTVYAFIMKWPEPPACAYQIRLESVRAKAGSAVTMLGLEHNFKYAQDDTALTIEIPDWFADPAKRPNPFVGAFKIQSERVGN